MPEGSDPIVTTVPESVSIDTGASPEDLKTLKDDFKDFWSEQDEGSTSPPEKAPAPEAPGPSQETKEGAAPVTEKPVAKTDAAKTIPAETKDLTPGSDYTDDEVDKLELLPGSQRPEVYQQFKEVKDMWKADRAKLRDELQKVRQVEAQLSEARANQLTPELKADYEHAVGIRRKFDYASDPEFVNKFHLPVINQYQNILDDAASMLADTQLGAQWAAYMKEKHAPDQLNRDWWMQSVIAKVPNELDRQALMGQLGDLFKLQKERNNEIHRRTNDSASFDAWIQEKTATTQKRIQEEIMAEIGIQEGRIKEVLPVDIAQAKTKEERAAMDAHNERFTKLNEHFVTTMKDLSANGPKAWVRAAIEATRTKIMDQQIVNLEKELKEVRTERDRFKGELEKISAVRRKISHTTGTPPASGAKPNGGLSLRDLDIRKSFKDFDWGEGSNK
jgi:hypothetical protein